MSLKKNSDSADLGEQAARSRSQVTPRRTFKKERDTLFFAGLVLMCVAVVVFMLWPDDNNARVESAGSTNNHNQLSATLAQNLELIAKMNASNQALQTPHGLTTQPTPSPIVQTTKSTGASLSQEALARMNAATSFSLETASTNAMAPAKTGEGTSQTLGGNSANTAFINQQDDLVAVHAKRIPHPRFTVPAGELIPATLEVAINSELPGMVRAITARDIYSLSGGTRLIPSGSSLVGQFNSGLVHGQNRLLVVWNRVQMPDGVIVTLSSPGTDMLGRAGQGANGVDRHFFERFGSSALLSILGGTTAMAGVSNGDGYNSKSQYRMGVAQSLQQAASQSLEDDSNIKPTLFINQGARINVFVAHDLDFYAVGSAYVANNPRFKRQKAHPWKQ